MTDKRKGSDDNMSGFKCYAVSKGRGVGIFDTWKECQKVIRGFQGARYRGFYSRADAENWLAYEGLSEKGEKRTWKK